MKTVQIPEVAGDVGAPTLEQLAVLANQVQELTQRCEVLESAIDELSGAPAPEPPPAPPPPPPAPPPPAPPPAFAWVEGQHMAARPSMPRPPKGQVVADPVYGLPLVRVTDHASEPPVGFARNDYARRNPFNCDETLQLVYALDGNYHVYDAETCQHTGMTLGAGSDCEPHWDPERPNVLRRFANYGADGALWETDVLTGRHTKLADIAPGFNAWTRAEGSPSADHRYWAVQCEVNWQTREIRCYDLKEQRLVGRLPVSSRPDHVSMSPCGRRVVVSYYGGGVFAYTPDFASRVRLDDAYGEHSDLVLMPDGTSAFVSVEYQSNGGEVYYTPLETGVRVPLFNNYPGSGNAFHFSGKCYDLPGWVLMSSYGGGSDQWFDGKIALLELLSGRTLNLCFHQAVLPQQDAYFFEPHAAISRSGRRVAFTSTWGTELQADINAYQVRLPAI